MTLQNKLLLMEFAGKWLQQNKRQLEETSLYIYIYIAKIYIHTNNIYIYIQYIYLLLPVPWVKSRWHSSNCIGLSKPYADGAPLRALGRTICLLFLIHVWCYFGWYMLVWYLFNLYFHPQTYPPPPTAVKLSSFRRCVYCLPDLHLVARCGPSHTRRTSFRQHFSKPTSLPTIPKCSMYGLFGHTCLFAYKTG